MFKVFEILNTYSCISNCSQNVKSGEAAQRLHRLECLAEGLVEYVADSSAPAQLVGLDVLGGALDGGAVGGGELGDDLQEKFALFFKRKMQNIRTLFLENF